MTHVADVVVQSSQVPSDQTDFVVYIDLSDLPTTEFWGTVANGGGDIRCYKSDGTTELAREVVSCDTATDTGALHVKFTGTLSSSSNTTIQIHADGSSSEPAADSTYGSEAVWSDYGGVWHGVDSSDATGNGNTLTEEGSGTAVAFDQPGLMGGAFEFDAAKRLKATHDSTIGPATGTYQAWYKPDASRASNGQIIKKDGTYILRDNWTSSQLYYIAWGSSGLVLLSTANPSAGSWHQAAGTYDATAAKMYLNGSQVDSDTGQSGSSSATNDLTIGGAPSEDFRGLIQEVRISSSVRSADWIETEYNNQSSPGTFYTVSAVSGDTTAPILTSPTASSTGETTASGSVSTDEANGTLYWVVTTSGTAPSAAQVQAGQDNSGSAAAASGSQSVSATGSQAISPTGLTADTTYTIHYQHEDAAGNDSTVVSSSSFTTDASATFSIALSIKVNTLL